MTEECIYNEMLNDFSDTLKETSKDKENNVYMTECQEKVVNVDKFKNHFIKNMSLHPIPRSCDALYMTYKKDFFMIEFKNGKIDALKNYTIKVKIFESLLMLSENFSETIKFMRNKMNFILVYNEDVKHGEKQYEDTGKDKNKQNIRNYVFKLANERLVRFGLLRFKKLYFKDVFTYKKEEFESEFVAKIIQSGS